MDDQLKGHTIEEYGKYIITHPWNFKVCDSCDSIVFSHVGLCPLCSAYCFNTDKDSVISTATKIMDPEYQRKTITFRDLLS